MSEKSFAWRQARFVRQKRLASFGPKAQCSLASLEKYAFVDLPQGRNLR